MVTSIFLSLFVLLAPISAHAAKLGTVVVDQAAVHEYPQPDSRVLGSILRDESYPVSNLPTEGFYKIRLGTGSVGWVSGNDIQLGGSGMNPYAPLPNSNPADPNANPAPLPIAPPLQQPRLPPPPDFSRYDTSRLILAFGIQYPSYDGLGQQYDIDGINPGFGFLFEFQFEAAKKSPVYWALRAEYEFSRTASAALSNGINQTIKRRGIPLEVGVNWSMLQDVGVRWSFGLYAGIVASSSVTIEQVGLNADNTTNYASIDPCVTGVTQIGINISPRVSLFGEAGYRYEKSGTLPAETWAATSVPAIQINYSGLIARLGFEFEFRP